jgi:hypothetical protein
VIEELECTAVLGNDPHDIVVHTVRDFRFDLERDAYLRAEKTGEVADDLLSDATGIPPNP